ncbi:RidA family protein [Planobispora siamensis]|uniref:RidA family protein n=1 Tax=Planobispora siamensis TaxID=936338 RepID=UPI00194E81AE
MRGDGDIAEVSFDQSRCPTVPGHRRTAARRRSSARRSTVPRENPDDPEAGYGDPVAQTRQVLANPQTALHAVGSELSRVLSSTVHVVADTPADPGRVWEVLRQSGLSAGPHTSTLLGVSCLGCAGQLVEITAVAAIPRGRRVPGRSGWIPLGRHPVRMPC